MTHTNGTTDPQLAHAHAEVADLASTYGLQLQLEHDPDAPMAFAVWCWAEDEDQTRSDAEIIGAGEAASEAVEEARKQLRRWHE